MGRERALARGSTAAPRLRGDYRNGRHRLFAPDIFTVEVGHVLSKLHRQRQISALDAQRCLAEILTSCPNLHNSLPLFPRAFELALQARASLYDCLYLALSESIGAPLVTADQRLIQNLGSPANIIHLSSF